MIENYQRIVFGRNDETRAKQNTVYRLTVYDVNLCIYSSKTVGKILSSDKCVRSNSYKNQDKKLSSTKIFVIEQKWLKLYALNICINNLCTQMVIRFSAEMKIQINNYNTSFFVLIKNRKEKIWHQHISFPW